MKLALEAHPSPLVIHCAIWQSLVLEQEGLLFVPQSVITGLPKSLIQ